MMRKTPLMPPFIHLVLGLVLLLTGLVPAGAQTGSVRFGVIGDFGSGDQNARDVANLVKSWSPDFIVTVGDNNYPDGASSTIDANIGQFYHGFIYPYTGSYGAGATANRFFPCLGNHDWGDIYPNPTGDQPFLNYFTLPNNERYYDFVWGPVHFFAIDSDPNEPSGTSSTSTQGNWLKNKLAASTAKWKIVYFHHSPYSSGSEHGSSTWMQWPFQQWGATAVLSGHDHDYERFLINGFPYFVNGLGGESVYLFGTPLSGSVKRYNSDYGAMLVQANGTSSIQFQFYSRSGSLIDSYTIQSTQNPASLALATRLVSESGPVNSVVDPGETVTVNFTLSNSGGPTANLTGTLLATSGVTAPSSPQTYGLIAGGASVTKPFTFTASGANGATITTVLQLKDGTASLGAVSNTFVLGPNNTLANTTLISIPSSGIGSPYPSKIPVAGLPSNPSKLTVTLSGLSHTYPDDVDVLLVGPSGQKVLLMSDAGGGAGINNVTLTFDDAAASSLSDSSAIVSGSYRPTDFVSGDTFPSPAPVGPYGSALSAFNGLNPNGTWSLYVVDDEASDSGSIAGGWSLKFTYPASTSPTIALTSPGSGATFAAPATVNLAANVTPNAHTITKVQFYNGTTSLAEDTTAPYELAWAGVAAGTYTLTARVVYDAGSIVNSAPVNISVGQNIGSANPTLVSIPDQGIGSLYPSKIPVAGLASNPSKVTVTLDRISHTYPDDLDILLVGPGGQKVLLMSDAGGSTEISNVTLTFDDAAASNLPDGSAIVPGTYKPTDFTTGDTFPSPAPAGPYGTALSVFNGLNPNGTWSLYVLDDEAGDSGSIAGGWSLKFAYGATPASTGLEISAQDALPAPWESADIGTGSSTGSAQYANGAYTVSEAGNSGGSAVNFRYVYQTLSGDGEIKARISTLQNTYGGRVGVMIRESLLSGSRHAFLGVDGTGAFRWQRRSSTGGNLSSSTGASGTAPDLWVRVVRAGNSLTGYESTGGVNWTQIGSNSITMGTNIYIGLAVVSGPAGTLNTSVFDNVTVVP